MLKLAAAALTVLFAACYAQPPKVEIMIPETFMARVSAYVCTLLLNLIETGPIVLSTVQQSRFCCFFPGEVWC